MTTATLPVHPFPARMAPELALRRLPRTHCGEEVSTVLDPMMGSGTIPVLASVDGHRAVGFDTDPLAVMIARTWGRPLDCTRYLESAERATEWARAGSHRVFRHEDKEAQAFIDYWFDGVTQRRLGALTAAIAEESEDLRDALWCAFSRLIITKDAGASRARDVSHSRPHRVRAGASFNPLERFPVAARAVVVRHRSLDRRRVGQTVLRLDQGDARALPLKDSSVDMVITSPPYLQAIDYLRGHRLSLVWMGYTVGELRRLRSSSIGTERGLPTEEWDSSGVRGIADGSLSTRGAALLQRYVADLGAVFREVHRVLKPGGHATFVVSEATIEGVSVRLSAALDIIAERKGFEGVEREQRGLPSSKRYLPPPKTQGTNSLDRRMRTEWCLTYRPFES